MSSILLFLAVIPVVVICTYIYNKDKNKEPWGLLIKLFVLGIASCFLVLAVSEVVFKVIPFLGKELEYMSFFEIMAYAFIGVALIEELCKWIMVYFGSYHHKAYDEVYDGIVYCVYVSLGFAFFENLLYVFGEQSIVVGISRGLLAVPGHACDAVFMGYYLSLAKVYASQGKKDLERKNLVLSIIVPTILHGIYDFCLMSGIEVLILVFFVFVIVMYITAIKKIKLLASQCKQYHQYQNPYAYNNIQSAHTQTQSIPGYVNQNITQQAPGYVNQNYTQQPSNYTNQNNNLTNKYCSNCGTPVHGQFCGKCGARQN